MKKFSIFIKSQPMLIVAAVLVAVTVIGSTIIMSNIIKHEVHVYDPTLTLGEISGLNATNYPGGDLPDMVGNRAISGNSYDFACRLSTDADLQNVSININITRADGAIEADDVALMYCDYHSSNSASVWTWHPVALFLDGGQLIGSCPPSWNRSIHHSGPDNLNNAFRITYHEAGDYSVFLFASVGYLRVIPISLNQVGSDTMYELGTVWAQGIHQKDERITVNVVGGGSSKGIQAFLNGSADIAQASRAMKDGEIATAEALGMEPIEIKVAIDGVAIIVHEDNPLTTLTLDQLEGLYNGTITEWAQLGIDLDGPVHLLGPNNNSGTYAYFKEVVLKSKNYSSSMTELAGNPALLNNVASDPLAIGYVGIGYAKEANGIKILSLSGPEHAAASPLDADAVISGDYVLSRYLYFYINGTVTGLMSEYLAWILEPEGGQRLAEEIGFYALPEVMLQEQRRAIGL